MPRLQRPVALDVRLREGVDPHRADARADDIATAELDHRHRQGLLRDHVDDDAQAAVAVEVALTDVAVDDRGAILADAREEGLDLDRRGVLRLVEQDESVLPGAAAHHLERHHLDGAVLEGDVVGGLADAFLDRFGDGRGPGRELVLERAGEEAERAPAGHVRARQDDLVDLAVAVEVGGMSGRDPGLAGARGPENDDLGSLAKSVEIVGLRGIERLYRRQRALAFEFGVLKFYDFRGSQQALMTASLLREVLTQGSDPSGGLKDKCIRQRTARGRGYKRREVVDASGRTGRAAGVRAGAKTKAQQLAERDKVNVVL